MKADMDLVIFEENKPLVLNGLKDGEFDYIEAAAEVFESEFFRFIEAKNILQKLAERYPSPRQKEEVPLWFYVASNLTMRLHGVHSFNAYPMVVRCGGMLNVFGPQVGQKVIHPDTGDITISCAGFNNKNHYDREAPCDQDYLRKLAKDTQATDLMDWFCKDVMKVFRHHGVFDQEGIFIGDGSYLFVPDNPNYEGSVTLRFDKDDHPVSKERYENMTEKQKGQCRWRRCYKIVTLLHTNRNRDFFIFAGVKVVPGNAHESSILYDLVEQFVDTVGKAVIKRLILDRGFIDGRSISRCKEAHGIDVLIPVRRDMDIYEDAKALFTQPEVVWVANEEPVTVFEPVRPRPRAVIEREKKRQKTIQAIKQQKPPPAPDKVAVSTESAAIGEFTTWASCTVPLTVIANRERYADGTEKMWFLIDTKEVPDPCMGRRDYRLRTTIEEQYRQLKCFCDLTKFTSCSFSLVVNQVIFIMLANDLLQHYLLRQGRQQLNNKPTAQIVRQLLPSNTHVIVYWENYYGLFSALELVGIIVRLGEEARKKVAAKCQRLDRQLEDLMQNPRSP